MNDAYAAQPPSLEPPTEWEARVVRYLHRRGFPVHRIAALFDGRRAMVNDVLAYRVHPNAGDGPLD